jgi:hypothetical protein
MSASFQSRFDAINNDVQNVNMEARRGIAAVAAITNTPMPSAPGKTSWAVNTSVFRGEFGTGFSLAHRLRTAIPLAVTVAYGNGGGRENIVRMGLMGEF